MEERMEGIVAILINLAVGAAGGNLAGLAVKAKSLGVMWNSVVGVVGGALGYFLMGVLGIGASAGLIGGVIAALVGGAVLLFIVSLIKKSA